jgi:AAA ATPase containing von Willebrand factor type A (vWA) domain
MAKYDNEIKNLIISNKKLEQLYEERSKTANRISRAINLKNFGIKKKREEAVKIKESDFGNIRENLNTIFKKYQDYLNKKSISTLEEFLHIILIGFALYEQLENVSLVDLNENLEDKPLEKFISAIESYKKIANEELRYTKYAKKFSTEQDKKEWDEKAREVKVRKEETLNEINKIVQTFLSGIFEDYFNFRNFISEDENIKTLAELTEINRKFSETSDPSDTQVNVRTLINNYLAELKKMDLEIEKYSSKQEKIENILKNVSENNDIINVLMHFYWANVLINQNIARYSIINKQYSKNSDITSEIRALFHTYLEHYKNKLTFRGNVKINQQMAELYEDVLTYDLITLEYNRNNNVEKTLQSFNGLNTTEKSVNFENDVIGTGKITFDGKNFNITASVEDMAKICNSLIFMDEISKHNINEKLYDLIVKDNIMFANGQFELKKKFQNERNAYLAASVWAEEFSHALYDKTGDKLTDDELLFLYKIYFETKEAGDQEILKALLKNKKYREAVIKRHYVQKENKNIIDTKKEKEILNASESSVALEKTKNATDETDKEKTASETEVNNSEINTEENKENENVQEPGENSENLENNNPETSSENENNENQEQNENSKTSSEQEEDNFENSKTNNSSGETSIENSGSSENLDDKNSETSSEAGNENNSENIENSGDENSEITFITDDEENSEHDNSEMTNETDKKENEEDSSEKLEELEENLKNEQSFTENKTEEILTMGEGNSELIPENYDEEEN